MLRPDDADFRGWRYETFEERLAFSAQPVADLWIDQAAEPIAEPSSALIEPLASVSAGSAPGTSQLPALRQQFGLAGADQTVAIIDSGIAYDHIALGGGFGSGHRVVGGWDFAENDANPYDDGPAGFHGTHVAGIVGADDRRHSGLAPSVDLVALRVFDDQGLGQFTWVEQALGWVHQHRLEFEHPITTVNLSLGTEWNAGSIPNWTALEDEFKQLADDGIFVSVAAGNGFQTTSVAGLSYPASSAYVVPVASVDASGNLSSFSQRDSRVLAAPGEKVTSTLPDAFFGGDGNKNDWGPSSGTSMASPYVAGASVLVREAMTRLGYTNINQSTIVDLFRRTADTVFDSVTNSPYQRINVERALTTLIGNDDFTSAAASASSLGQLSTTLTVSGVIGSADDRDFFRFVAAQSGRASLSLRPATGAIVNWLAAPGGRIDGQTLTLDVVAGQTYTVGVTGGGVTIGKYDVTAQLSRTPSPALPAINLGMLEQTSLRDIPLTGNDTWFQITAGRTGRFTAEAAFAHAAGNIDLEIYDSRQRLIGVSRGTGNGERIDLDVRAGDKLFARVRGTNKQVDLRLTNLVTIAGHQVQVAGTASADSLRWQAGAQQQIIVNGVSYRLASGSHIQFEGRGGNDSLDIAGLAPTDSAIPLPLGVQVSGRNYGLTATGVESVHIVGGWRSSPGNASLQTTAVVGPRAPLGPLPPGIRQFALAPPTAAPQPTAPPPTASTPGPGLRQLVFSLLGIEPETTATRRRSNSHLPPDPALLEAAFCQLGSE